jgi:hypothetical protein
MQNINWFFSVIAILVIPWHAADAFDSIVEVPTPPGSDSEFCATISIKCDDKIQSKEFIEWLKEESTKLERYWFHEMCAVAPRPIVSTFSFAMKEDGRITELKVLSDSVQNDDILHQDNVLRRWSSWGFRGCPFVGKSEKTFKATICWERDKTFQQLENER